MRQFINDNDKEPSWDGFVYTYKNQSLKVEDIEYRVPVQVKGKNDERLLKKQTIQYPVEYKHLRNCCLEDSDKMQIAKESDCLYIRQTVIHKSRLR